MRGSTVKGGRDSALWLPASDKTADALPRPISSWVASWFFGADGLVVFARERVMADGSCVTSRRASSERAPECVRPPACAVVVFESGETSSMRRAAVDETTWPSRGTAAASPVCLSGFAARSIPIQCDRITSHVCASKSNHALLPSLLALDGDASSRLIGSSAASAARREGGGGGVEACDEGQVRDDEVCKYGSEEERGQEPDTSANASTTGHA